MVCLVLEAYKILCGEGSAAATSAPPSTTLYCAQYRGISIHKGYIYECVLLPPGFNSITTIITRYYIYVFQSIVVRIYSGPNRSFHSYGRSYRTRRRVSTICSGQLCCYFGVRLWRSFADAHTIREHVIAVVRYEIGFFSPDHIEFCCDRQNDFSSGVFPN